MENKKSLLKLSSITILDTRLSIRIPTVGEILEDERTYYSMISAFTAGTFQYMVELDDMGIDFTAITDYELFKIIFPAFAKSDLSLLFGNLDMSDFDIYKDNSQREFLYSPGNDLEIDEKTYLELADTIRKINLLEKVAYRPGNESARKYLLEKERRKRKRNSRKPYGPYLEKLVVSLVNTSEFPYNYESCMDLSIYKFNQSFRQIQHKIAFDNMMIGVYAGTVDVSRLSDKNTLSWIPDKY